MKYPSYPEYKESGVEWLGEVPGHWEMRRLKFLLQDVNGIKIGPFGSALKLEDMEEEGIKVYGQENIIANDYNAGYRRISPEKFQEMKIYELNPGDIIITLMGTSGKCQIFPDWAETGIMDSHLLRLKTKTIVYNKYIQILIDQSSTVQAQINMLGKGSIMQGLNSGIVKSLIVPLPPVSEQRAIAAFLDAQTAKIDTLIAKKKELSDRLKEKRAALITRAVTKGLDPNVKMKDSGVEWLGEVPEHWGVKRLKYAVQSLEQGWSPQCENTPVSNQEEWGVLKVGCVNGGIFKPDENKALPSELQPIPSLGIVEGDLIISRANTRELVGSASVAKRHYPNLMLCDKLYRIRLKLNTVMPVYLAQYLSINMVRGQIELRATGASDSMQNISQSTITELLFPAPSIEEQLKILNFLDHETAKLDTLTAKVEAAIARLQEYRSALITAAVTGKFKVQAI